MHSKIKCTQRQRTILKEYATQNRDALMSNLYMNIWVGFNRFPKRYGFFKNLAKKLQKTSTKSKAMYCQAEEHLLVKSLQIPKEHYDLFRSIMKFETSQDSLDHVNVFDSSSKPLNQRLSTGRNPEHSDKFQRKIERSRLTIVEDFLKKKIKLTFFSKGKTQLTFRKWRVCHKDR